MTEREAVIRECIEYMRQRPGRRGVASQDRPGCSPVPLDLLVGP
jgi:hypothetical protein